MKQVRYLVGLLLMMATSVLGAQTIELQGEVFWFIGNEKKTEAGLFVTIKESGRTDDTNDRGVFRIALPEHFKAGRVVTLTLDKAGMAIYRPLEGRLEIPHDPMRIVEVELLPLGAKLFLQEDRIEKFVESVATRPKPEDGSKVEIDFSREIRDWATRYGFSAEQAKVEVDRWIANVKKNHRGDLNRLGLVAFAENKFEEAAKRFHEHGEWTENELEKIRTARERLATEESRFRLEAARAFRLEGEAHSNGDQFDKAVIAYRRALGYVTRTESPPRALGVRSGVDIFHYAGRRTSLPYARGFGLGPNSIRTRSSTSVGR
ncbi:MAG: hypothetical protein GY854_11200 [Deltaproteobacteria bacterium]|nr:hypothetical protein [Deltaproteobacteria bacterium]